MQKLLLLVAAFATGCVGSTYYMEKASAGRLRSVSDTDLCSFAFLSLRNPAIQTEILKRELMSEDEMTHLFAERPTFPKIGMSRCAMHATAWTYAELVSSVAGTEVWKLPQEEGPEIFWDYKPAMIIIKDGRIVDRVCERDSNGGKDGGSCDFLDGQFEERFIQKQR